MSDLVQVERNFSTVVCAITCTGSVKLYCGTLLSTCTWTNIQIVNILYMAYLIKYSPHIKQEYFIFVYRIS